jgi:hypothetical protein
MTDEECATDSCCRKTYRKRCTACEFAYDEGRASYRDDYLPTSPSERFALILKQIDSLEGESISFPLAKCLRRCKQLLELEEDEEETKDER